MFRPPRDPRLESWKERKTRKRNTSPLTSMRDLYDQPIPRRERRETPNHLRAPPVLPVQPVPQIAHDNCHHARVLVLVLFPFPASLLPSSGRPLHIHIRIIGVLSALIAGHGLGIGLPLNPHHQHLLDHGSEHAEERDVLLPRKGRPPPRAQVQVPVLVLVLVRRGLAALPPRSTISVGRELASSGTSADERRPREERRPERLARIGVRGQALAEAEAEVGEVDEVLQVEADEGFGSAVHSWHDWCD